jgi:hypothetical protein
MSLWVGEGKVKASFGQGGGGCFKLRLKLR